MIAELIEKMKSAAINDTALAAWCTATYGKAPTFLVGVDENNPPAESDYPVIVAVATKTGRSTADKNTSLTLEFGLGLIDSDTATTDGTTYYGTIRMETFRELFEDAVFRAKLVGTVSVEGESGDNMYPLFVGYVTLTISAPKSYMAGIAR